MKADDTNHLGALERVSHEEWDADSEGAMLRMQGRLMRRLAEIIVVDCAVFTNVPQESFVELRVDLYVGTPEQFWNAVRKEAQSIAGIIATRNHP
jgi:hypothetical protein